MANDIPISVARDVLKKYNLKQVLILCNDHDNNNHIITYGYDKENCKLAGLAGDFWKDVLKWPSEKRSKYTNEIVSKLATEIEEKNSYIYKLQRVMRKIINISDREHQAWDDAKKLLKGCDVDDDTTLYLILLEDGKCPEIKKPQESQLKEWLQKYEETKPDTRILIARVRNYNNDLWVDEGKEELSKILAFEGLAESYKENVAKTQKCLDLIKEKYPSKYKYVKEFMDEGEIQHDFTHLEIVSEPRGKKSDCYKYTWVNEMLGGGMEGDSFAGDGYVFLAKNTYVKIPYSM